jgi:small subunit ribosomal protein S7
MRKSKPKKRILLPDPKFNDQLVTRFVNMLMLQGRKNTSYAIFYDALERVEEKTKENGLDTWKKAMTNVMPTVEVKSRRVGGATFQIPTEIRPDRRIALSIKWLIGYARARNEKSMADKLANELIAASKNEGAAIKKKEDTHKMAEANKAFAHFRSN